MWIASFDIGTKNFAFIILHITDVSSNPPKFKIVDFGNLDIRDHHQTYSILNLIDVLDSYKTLWDDCDLFLVEQQMQSRHASNIKALKVSQHVLAYFTIAYKESKKIIEYPSYYKTQVFGAPKMTKYERKQWSVKKAESLLMENGYTDLFKELKKKDDVSDVLCQALAYVIQQQEPHVRLL